MFIHSFSGVMGESYLEDPGDQVGMKTTGSAGVTTWLIGCIRRLTQSP